MLSIEEYRFLPAQAIACVLLSGPLLTALPPASAQTPAATTSPIPAASAPSNPTPNIQAPPEEVGDTLVVHQRYQAAIQAYAKAPQTAAVWNKMGIAYQMMFNLRDATRCYKESIRLDPRNPNVLNNLGTIYDSLKDYRQAEHMYRKALKLDPKSAIVLKNLGTNLLAQHKHTRGWEAYQQALAIDPQVFQDRNSPQVQNPSSVQERGAMNYYMAMGCVRAGLTDCALQYLRMALNEGYTNSKKVAADVAFASLRDNPDFKQLLAAQDNHSKAPQAR
ncbi:MAG TPA: tetratricopeptide repeat protein [Terracidiphilus sp.]|jgi:tetratricopeptide (TPR) repeat protein